MAPLVRQELDNGNFVFLKIKHKNIRTLLCISLSLVRALRLQQDVMPALCNKNLFTADGQPMKVCGTISLSINIKGLIVPFTLHVLERLTHNLILGIDFFESNKS